jgi:hypothetical protein
VQWSAHKRRIARRVLQREPLLFALWSAVCTLTSARAFYGYMLKQTHGEWSAPLDDVFIHFDYARATAQGHPFEWVVGNGYSSGNTSLLYPCVLAIGYRLGFVGQTLMVWAAVVAACSVFAVLLVARWLFVERCFDGAPADGARPLTFFQSAGDPWGRLTSYLLPPVFLGVGALDWSLWSGMEVAFFLLTWAVSLAAYLHLIESPESRIPRLSWWLGVSGVLMILTRPEAVTTIAVFGVAAALTLRPRVGSREAALVLLRVGAPGALTVGAQAVMNRALTGEWSANGAIVKLAIYSPFLNAQAKLDDYLFNFKYEIFRNLEYHLTDAPPFGAILVALALAALAMPRTRRFALLLWGQLAGWVLIVALNAQVRWQNERYTMPAVAWLLVLAALGAGGLLRRSSKPSALIAAGAGVVVVETVIATLPGEWPAGVRAWGIVIGAAAVAAVTAVVWPLRAAAVVAALVVAQIHLAPKMRDQKWFFGRACRNIRDQHVTAGRWLRALGPHRVLLSDAGALIYASDQRGLDIMGLGGYQALPFARASVNGLTATIELMERVAPSDRPDYLAIYPSWWGILPTWFGSGVVARFPAEGNVICGGYEDVIYRADWSLLGTGASIRALPAGERVRDEVDVADIMSEAAHDYEFPSHTASEPTCTTAFPSAGCTEMKILTDPADSSRDMLDGGRRITPGLVEHLRFSGLERGRPAHLVIRSAPYARTVVRARVNGAELEPLAFEAGEAWIEREVAVPPAAVSRTIDVTLTNDGPSDFIDYHLWATQ